MRLISQRNLSIALLSAGLAFGSIACKQKAPVASPDGTPAAQTAPADDNIIRIGEVGSMTGAQATFGTSTHQGIELAVKQVNDAGGVKGKKLEVIALDDQGKPEEAATAVTK